MAKHSLITPAHQPEAVDKLIRIKDDLELNRLANRRYKDCVAFWIWGLGISFGAFIAVVILSGYIGTWALPLIILGGILVTLAQLIDCPRCGKSLLTYKVPIGIKNWPNAVCSQCDLMLKPGHD